MPLHLHPKTAKAVRRKYNLLAALYDRLWPHYLRRTIQAALNPLQMNGGETILDIGCGTGELERTLLQKFPHLKITGIDLSKDMLERAEAKMMNRSAVEFIEGDFLKVSLPENHFDIAFSLSNLHYFHDPASVFAKIRGHLKPGGRFVLIDWNRHSLKAKFYNWYMGLFDPGFAKVYTPEEASALLKENGFTIESTDASRVSLFWYMMRVVARRKEL